MWVEVVPNVTVYALNGSRDGDVRACGGVGDEVCTAAFDFTGVVVGPMCSNDMLVDVVKHYLYECSPFGICFAQTNDGFGM